MRLVSRSTHSSLEQRRERARRRRDAALTLGASFPEVEQVRVELVFREPAGPDPCRQLHDLYPAAAAILEFVCPYGDCDGHFDLTESCLGVLQASSPTGEGVVACGGSRPAPGAKRRQCTLQLRYRVFATYKKKFG